MVKRKGESWSSEKMRKYAKDRYPGIRVKTNKPYDKGAAFLDPDTGRVLREGESNFDLMDKETAPDAATLKQNKSPKLFDVPPEINIKSYAEKKFTEGLSHIIEAMEVSGVNENPRFVLGEDGFAKSLKVGNMEFDLHGMKGKKNWE